ncbi:glutaredoxin [Natrialba magadii ATCC 43099]|uniref:Glutaredoxin n=1 Tax=Natrialba magadii (strain ATCC 43099 / DSM 3394 / CCM 3739 / CIP 104546 / IAM 13178 / JCM 8861 / NBRC 102185 / NCIMB 2190 / MS3) TaxID=547559 RepID=D3SS33_NATMM|nr:glutaredoxin domain-containing protein [Natrialba magadii]ADD04759.1 glutaredoxin [Natrialba magadii ATCC 43099]ELY24926.1 glutaredoxin [Natrialba magadii ATCC 43099]
MADITLYNLPGCPFCVKVQSKLDELELEYDVINVERDHAKRTEVEAVSGQTGVPVITDEATDVEGMHESDDIVAYLEEMYGA